MADRKLQALIAGGSRDYILSIKRNLEQMSAFGRCAIAYSGYEALDKFNSLCPDLLVTDIILRGLDGLSLLEKIQGSDCAKNCKILICTSANTDSIVRKVFDYGADFFLIKPFPDEVLHETVRELLHLDGAQGGYLDGGLESRIMGVIQRIGLPPGSKGYHYSQYAIKRLVEDRSLMEQITTKLYPEIAEKYGSTVGRVERNIRHAIETAWNKGDLEYIQQLFGYTVDEEKGKPTNAAFLATVVNYIQLSMYRVN